MKYNNKKCVYMGIKFDSLGEKYRYIYLKNLEEQGILTELELQPVFKIEINGVKICRYIADFSYQYKGEFVVEDFKGVETAVFKLKKKMVKAMHGIDIKIIKSPTEWGYNDV